jgi:hypothetical protein
MKIIYMYKAIMKACRLARKWVLITYGIEKGVEHWGALSHVKASKTIETTNINVFKTFALPHVHNFYVIICDFLFLFSLAQIIF